MTPERLARIKQTLDTRQPDLRVLTDQVHKPRNLSAIIRSCDAFGVANMHVVWPREGFRAFRKRGQDHVMAELTRHLAALISVGDEKLGALVDKETGTDIREVWTPTAANFFNRVGGPYLNALWCELLDLSEDHPTATSFAKLKKGEKADRLEKLFADAETREAFGVTEAQGERIAKWLPEGMAFESSDEQPQGEVENPEPDVLPAFLKAAAE